jgi:secreted protein with Ig-like and vWFA domain
MTSGGESEDSVKPIPLTQRKFVANYLGRAQGKAGRLQLIELAEKFPHEVCC